MAEKVRKENDAVPPPIYDPNSSNLSISIHYGGTFINVPVPKFVGGKALIADYIDGKTFTIQDLEDICDSIPGLSEQRRFYVECYENPGFKIILSDKALVEHCMLFVGGCIAMPLYVDAVYINPSQVEDNFDATVERVVRAVETSFNEVVAREDDDTSYEMEMEDIDDDSEFENFVDDAIQENVDELLQDVDPSGLNLGSYFVDLDNAAENANTEHATVDLDMMQEEDENSDSDFIVEDEVEQGDDDRIYLNHVDADVEDNLDEEGDPAEIDADVVGSDVELDENVLSDEEANEPHFIDFDIATIYDPIFNVGQVFVNRADFMKAVNSHAIRTKRNLWFSRNDPERVYARCRVEDCEWRINLVKRINQNGFFIREYFTEHNCVPTWDVKNLTSTWLAEKYLHTFKADPKRNVEGFRLDVVRELRINVSKDQAYRAKRLALRTLQGKPDEQYAKLWDYAEELRTTNPGSTIILGTENRSGETRFCRFYVCFKALKDGFKSGCRPIIGVDGCHLKGPHGGVLLSAVGVDSNNSIYPVAYAVVGQEKTETWAWFLTILKRDLEIVRNEYFTIMSDKQKGLINAIAEVFPGAPNRFCVRHILNNFIKAGFRGAAFKNALWLAAKSSTIGHFRAAMQKMKDLDERAAEWFNDKSPEQWSWSHFSTTSKSDMLLNNCCESFNSSILAARDKPIITMLEWIREHLMTKLQEGRDEAAKWNGLLCPKIKEILNDHMQKVADCIPIKADDYHYQISTCDGGMFAVDLANKCCTCRKWEISGIPCKHALAAIIRQRRDPETFVDECYWVETYKRSYAPVMFPISGQELWSQALFIPPMPPNFGRGVGRPKRVRRRELEEPNTHGRRRRRGRQPLLAIRRQTPTVYCSCCGNPGHNVRACPQKGDLEDIQVREMRRSHKGKGKQVVRNLFGEGTSAQGTEGTTSTLIDVHNDGNQNMPAAREPTVISSELRPPTRVQGTNTAPECDVVPLQGTSISNILQTPQTTLPGPSMFQQMQLGQNVNGPMPNQVPRTGSGLQSRLNMRVPPPMQGCTFVNRTFRPISRSQTRQVQMDGGQRVISLSDLCVPDSQPTQGSANN